MTDSVAPPEIAQQPPSLSEISNAANDLQCLNKSGGGSTSEEIGSANVYESTMIIAHNPANDDGLQWLRQLIAKVDDIKTKMATKEHVAALTAAVDKLGVQIDSVRAEVAHLHAENRSLVLENQGVRPRE